MNDIPALVPRIENDEQARALLDRFGVPKDIPLDDIERISEFFATSTTFQNGVAEYEDQKKLKDAKLDEEMAKLGRNVDMVWIISHAEFQGMATLSIMDAANGSYRTQMTIPGTPTGKDCVLAIKRAMCFPENGEPVMPGTIYFAWRMQPLFGEIAAWLDTLQIDRELERREDAVAAENEVEDPERAFEQDQARARTEIADLKSKGNDAYRKKDIVAAINHYTKALQLYRDTKVFPDQDAVAADKAVLFSNRAAAYLKSPHRLKEALQDADRAVALAPEYPRAYVRKAMALKALDRVDEAVECLVEKLKEGIEEPKDLVQMLSELVDKPDDERLKELGEKFKEALKVKPAETKAT